MIVYALEHLRADGRSYSHREFLEFTRRNRTAVIAQRNRLIRQYGWDPKRLRIVSFVEEKP